MKEKKMNLKNKLNKRGALVQIILFMVAVGLTAVFIYAINDLQKQKEEGGNQTVSSFGDFLKDIFKKSEVKEKAKDAEKTLGCMAKVNQCLMKDVTCMPVYENGIITFTMTNMIKKINYDLSDVQISIEAGDCTGNLTGLNKLYGSGGAGPMRANYTIKCDFDKCLEGNITLTAQSKEHVAFSERAQFSIKE